MSKAVIDREHGIEQRSLGLWACELNNTDFIAKARAVARLICRVQGNVSVDEVRTHPSMNGLQPSSSHVYGTLFNEKGWKCVGMEQSKVKSNRARRILRWTWQP